MPEDRKKHGVIRNYKQFISCNIRCDKTDGMPAMLRNLVLIFI